MKKFDYKTLNNFTITPEITQKLIQISELRGKIEASSLESHNAILERLIEVAKIQSTEASNGIEGIHTTDTRLKQIMARKVMPRNRSEEEISGYRDVLDLIHQQYTYIPVSSNTILTLHKHLFSFTASNWGGKFKDIDNQIVETLPDGTEEIRFDPPKAFMTPTLINDLCLEFNNAIQKDQIPSLILCAAFVFDFVSIHPFRDGNGRISRLLTLLVLYQANYGVGRYISLESLIEKLKPQYYQALEESSVGWSDNTNSYLPFINYFLSIILQAYRELDSRITPTTNKSENLDILILQSLQNELRPLSKRDLMAYIPQYGQSSIEHALMNLSNNGKIRKVGGGRSTKYVLVI
ncbi:Fic family protein [Companilactobacillus ginsenosidimutans]|uniref:Cell division protein Fic n=1 Tax=Companilactobacillus ginsenosidimutans TaxID=1007676 RepID=A0A0H4R1H5_9LACO|nr:Fic family protein [Companilactobacillus ginsenosidimutans]AKP67580.1 cell division protein Fic [Companilactobacillus ginsenosidimutans]